jgi:hypothetical protein
VLYLLGHGSCLFALVIFGDKVFLFVQASLRMCSLPWEVLVPNPGFAKQIF